MPLGAVIMEGFYVVFDRENIQIGFAATTCGSEGRLNPRLETEIKYRPNSIFVESLFTKELYNWPKY